MHSPILQNICIPYKKKSYVVAIWVDRDNILKPPEQITLIINQQECANKIPTAGLEALFFIGENNIIQQQATINLVAISSNSSVCKITINSYGIATDQIKVQSDIHIEILYSLSQFHKKTNAKKPFREGMTAPQQVIIEIIKSACSVILDKVIIKPIPTRQEVELL